MAFPNIDITGVLPANRINNEQAVIVQGTTDLHGPLPYVIPQYAPFYGPNFQIRRNGVLLTENVDYQFVVQSFHARDYIGKDFYGAVAFLDRSASGNVTYSYNTLGGPFITNDHQLLADYFNTLLRQRSVNWDAVYGVPVLLPPIQGQQNLADLRGVDDMVAALDAIRDAIANGDYGPIITLVNNLSAALLGHESASNPHGTSKGDVGLGLVENYKAVEQTSSMFLTGADTRYLTTGDATRWEVYRRAILQLPTADTKNPSTTANVIFKSNTLNGITLPAGQTATGDLYVVQIRLDHTSTAALNTLPRIQLGFLVSPGNNGNGNHLLLRMLDPAVTTNNNWAVVPNFKSLSDYLVTLTNTIQTQVDTAVNQRIRWGVTNPTAANFAKVGDVYFKIET